MVLKTPLPAKLFLRWGGHPPRLPTAHPGHPLPQHWVFPAALQVPTGSFLSPSTSLTGLPRAAKGLLLPETSKANSKGLAPSHQSMCH